MDVITMARELGKMLQQDERYLRVMSASAKSDASQLLQEKIHAFTELRSQIAKELMSPDKDQEKVAKMDAELRSRYNEIMAAPEMVDYNAAKSELDALISFINQIITGSAEGRDPDTIEQSSGCTGSCASCGGCH